MAENKLLHDDKEMIWNLLGRVLSEATGNRLEDIHPESLVYSELNLTEYDLQLIIKKIAPELEIDGESLAEAIVGNDEVVTVADVLDLIMDEKELG